MDFPVPGSPGQTNEGPGLVDVVGMMAGRPVKPATVERVSWILEEGQQRVDAQGVGTSVGEQAGEDFVDESATCGYQRRGGQGEGPIAEVGAPLGAAAIEFEVLAEPAMRVAGRT